MVAQGVLAEIWKVNRIDDCLEENLRAVSARARGCVTLEDNVPRGGIGESMAVVHRGCLDRLDTGERFLPHGSVADVEKFCGIDAESVAAFIMKTRNTEEQELG